MYRELLKNSSLLCLLVLSSTCLFLVVGQTTTGPACPNNLREVSLSVDKRLVDETGGVASLFDTCSNFSKELNGQQLGVCRTDKDYLGCFARGMRRAVRDCASIFSNNMWNCTHAVREMVFGRFIHQMDVSERATVVALLSAGVMYELTACCRERMLDDCHCNYSLPTVDFELTPKGEAVYKYGGCSDRLDTPARRTRTLLKIDGNSDNNCDKVDKHNAEVGIKMASVTKVHCHCHGLSASCNIKTCKHRIMPFNYITSKMQMKYSGAVKVHPPTKGTFTPVNENADRPTDEDLVYSHDSPNPCNPNKTLDIPGTHGRRCYPEKQGRGSCDMLCCSKGYYKRSRQVPVYVLRIVDFRVIQEVASYRTVTEFFCN